MVQIDMKNTNSEIISRKVLKLISMISALQYLHSQNDDVIGNSIESQAEEPHNIGMSFG